MRHNSTAHCSHPYMNHPMFAEKYRLSERMPPASGSELPSSQALAIRLPEQRAWASSHLEQSAQPLEHPASYLPPPTDRRSILRAGSTLSAMPSLAAGMSWELRKRPDFPCDGSATNSERS